MEPQRLVGWRFTYPYLSSPTPSSRHARWELMTTVSQQGNHIMASVGGLPTNNPSSPSFRLATHHRHNPFIQTMSLNDMNLGVAKGADVYDGISNPTSHSNASNPLTRNLVRTTHTLTSEVGLRSLRRLMIRPRRKGLPAPVPIFKVTSKPRGTSITQAM